MKKTILIALTFLSNQFLLAQNEIINDLKIIGLNGKVKCITESIYTAVKNLDKIEKGALTNKMIEKFNEKGNKIEIRFFYANGSLQTRVTFKYDTKGKMIEKNEYVDGSLYRKQKVKYDKNGQVISETEIEEIISVEGMFEKVVYKIEGLDQADNWLKQIKFIEDTPKTITERVIDYY